MTTMQTDLLHTLRTELQAAETMLVVHPDDVDQRETVRRLRGQIIDLLGLREPRPTRRRLGWDQ